jgi:glycosyltransferase involved in cell wall biosynthesis
MNTLALCIPAYNAGTYLPQLLQSARNQIIPFDEILVYNDCSTDDTEAVAQKYGATVLNGDINRGCSYGKNQLAAYTKCNWIHFHDADDDLLPDFTTLAYKWMNNTQCPDIVLFNYEYREYHTDKLISVRSFDKEALENDPVAYAILNQINPFCGLYKKQSFIDAGGYDTDPLILYNEDSAFHIKMAIAGLKFTVEEKLSIINYHIHSSMSSANKRKCLLAQFHVLEKTAHKTLLKYAYEIALKLWGIIGIFAAMDEWGYVEKTLALCRKLGYSHPPAGSQAFKLLTYINSYMAVWFREKMIRLLKPQLRD